MTKLSTLKEDYSKELSSGTDAKDYTSVNIPYRSVDELKKDMKIIGVGVLRDVPSYAAVKIAENITKISKDLTPLMMMQQNRPR